MELKHTNLNGGIVLARYLNLVNFLLIMKIELRNELYKCFFQEDE